MTGAALVATQKLSWNATAAVSHAARTRIIEIGELLIWSEAHLARDNAMEEGARVLAGLRSGEGPLSVRARPSSIKRDCDRRATSTGEKRLVNVHAKSCLTPEPLRTLRSETKGQAGACPDRTRAIPCTVQAVTRKSAPGLRTTGGLQACPEMSPDRHQRSTVATSSNL